ncbi:MAG TPA: peptidase M23 [Sedimenticola thiotaurini]|uniref:Peptidase M23 n=1 Tax=Sedimenticola thiotaurini TaxID=1543721 RepID=A0A831W730_9GAMM|nr:peptidase M23 [Sedimenticola thiotaurini]
MTAVRRRWWIGLLLLALTQAGAGVAEDPQQALQRLRQDIERLTGDLASTGARYQELQAQLEQSERLIGDSGRRLHRLDREIGQQRQRLQELERRRHRQQEALAQQREALARQIRAAYAMGRQQRMKILLNQQDPAMVSRMLVYYDYLNSARLARIREIRGLLAELGRTEQEIDTETERLTGLREREQAEQRRLNQTRQQREKVLAALERELTDKGERLKTLKQNEQRLQTLIDRLQRSLEELPQVAAEKPLKALKGRLPWPLKGRLTARFGTPKAGNLRWDGVMIAAPEGREVKAVHRGRVAFADWLRGYGLLLIIDHGDGYMTLYGNNQSLYKETGEWVETGEPVARAGNSGGRRSSGIYFGIRVRGTAVNPRAWCRRGKGNRVGQRRARAPGSVGRTAATAAGDRFDEAMTIL